MRARAALGALLLSAVCAACCLLLAVTVRWQPGSRYVSWLPSFSVEVTRVREPPSAHLLEAMIEQVQQVFPQYPRALLAADLASSRSADLTIDNILEGRLPPPPAVTPTMPSTIPPTMPPAAPSDAADAAVSTSPRAHHAAQTTEPHHVEDSAEHESTQFSQNASEREAMLRRRKEALLATARRRYLERMAARPADLATATATATTAATTAADSPRS